jgi:hypothetical protein
VELSGFLLRCTEKPTDYRCLDACCLVSGKWATIKNHNSLSISGTEVNPGIRSWKNEHSCKWAEWQKVIGAINFTKNEEPNTLQHGLVEFAYFQPRLYSVVFKCVLWLKGLSFDFEDGGFLKWESRSIEWHQFLLLSRQNVFCLQIYLVYEETCLYRILKGSSLDWFCLLLLPNINAHT